MKPNPRLQPLISALAVLALAATAWAQRGMGDPQGLARQGLRPDIVTIEGTVKETVIGPCELTTGRSFQGAHLIVTTDAGKEYNVHLGPSRFVKKATNALTEGDPVTLRVFHTDRMPEDNYVAVAVKAGDQTIRLRNKNLRPVWAGRRGRRAGQGPPFARRGRYGPRRARYWQDMNPPSPKEADESAPTDNVGDEDLDALLDDLDLDNDWDMGPGWGRRGGRGMGRGWQGRGDAMGPGRGRGRGLGWGRGPGRPGVGPGRGMGRRGQERGPCWHPECPRASAGPWNRPQGDSWDEAHSMRGPGRGYGRGLGRKMGPGWQGRGPGRRGMGRGRQGWGPGGPGMGRGLGMGPAGPAWQEPPSPDKWAEKPRQRRPKAAQAPGRKQAKKTAAQRRQRMKAAQGQLEELEEQFQELQEQLDQQRKELQKMQRQQNR